MSVIHSSLDEVCFEAARFYLSLSTCLKTKTAATICKEGKIIAAGWNLCAPGQASYGDTLFECPRMQIKTGGEYQLCKPVHAEVMACLNVRPQRAPEELAPFAGHLAPAIEQVLAAFSATELALFSGATMYLVGHYWACDNCVRFSKIVGIADIRFDKITGEATKSLYETRKLTGDELK